jgi:hypothetical protein
MEIGHAFMRSKTLLSAIELGLFTELAKGGLDAEALRERLGLHSRGAQDFFDALVALEMLERDETGCYWNTPETDYLLDKAKLSYIGAPLELANARLYPFWGSFTEALRSGQPQNEAKTGEKYWFSKVLYRDPRRLKQYLQAMTDLSNHCTEAIAKKFPWGKYRTFVDIGTAQGNLPVQVALIHPHLSGGGFDVPPVGPVFNEYVASFGLSDRLVFFPGNFFHDPLPHADVLVMGHILHDWNLAEKRMLLAKAYEALFTDGVLIICEKVIDNQRRKNLPALMSSLNLLIDTPGGFEFTEEDCYTWLREAGFQKIYTEQLNFFESMIVGIK